MEKYGKGVLKFPLFETLQSTTRKTHPSHDCTESPINNSMLMDAAHTRTLSHYIVDEYTLTVLSQVFNENLMHYL